MKREEFVIRESYTWELRGPFPAEIEAGESDIACERQTCAREASDEADLEPRQAFLLGVKSALEMLKEALEHTEVVLGRPDGDCEGRADGGSKTNHRVRG